MADDDQLVAIMVSVKHSNYELYTMLNSHRSLMFLSLTSRSEGIGSR